MSNGRFIKGQSGNPNGRPRGVTDEDVKALARKHTGSAIETLASIALNGRGEVARVSAAVALLDRGWGRPKQEIDLDANVKLNADAEFAELAAAMDSVARAVAGGLSLEDAMASERSPVAGHA